MACHECCDPESKCIRGNCLSCCFCERKLRARADHPDAIQHDKPADAFSGSAALIESSRELQAQLREKYAPPSGEIEATMSILPRCKRHGVLLDDPECADCASLRAGPEHLVPGPPPYEFREDCSCSACAKVRGARAVEPKVGE